MIVKTATSIYEVRQEQKLFRRVHQFDRADSKLPIGQWYRFQRMSPVVLDEPVRFFWVLGEEAGVARIGLWATSAVVEVIEDGAADTDSAFLRPERRGGHLR